MFQASVLQPPQITPAWLWCSWVWACAAERPVEGAEKGAGAGPRGSSSVNRVAFPLPALLALNLPYGLGTPPPPTELSAMETKSTDCSAGGTEGLACLVCARKASSAAAAAAAEVACGADAPAISCCAWLDPSGWSLT
ncbi:hypothetical protein TSOC_005555 [Tetrabaena socialis]|uniref:Secreted protein n=1 Tax=Tetrabaena socialis TaxID=47790 RepID=A0A2J8A608_9CHLO|nr:hypothetical protein TSOC_005555 [Tetrabaena socialis]|eukprot:PNH07935.1 hypothetical protein TSOC_005555 [Tetrabaena socialis]